MQSRIVCVAHELSDVGLSRVYFIGVSQKVEWQQRWRFPYHGCVFCGMVPRSAYLCVCIIHIVAGLCDRCIVTPQAGGSR